MLSMFTKNSEVVKSRNWNSKCFFCFRSYLKGLQYLSDSDRLSVNFSKCYHLNTFEIFKLTLLILEWSSCIWKCCIKLRITALSWSFYLKWFIARKKLMNPTWLFSKSLNKYMEAFSNTSEYSNKHHHLQVEEVSFQVSWITSNPI